MKLPLQKLYSFWILFCLILALTNFICALETEEALAWEVSYPQFFGVSPEGGGLVNYINYIFNAALGIGGILAFVMIVVGGVKLMVSGGNPSKISDAKDQITSAIIGLLLLLGSWLILNTINPQLTVLTLPELP